MQGSTAISISAASYFSAISSIKPKYSRFAFLGSKVSIHLTLDKEVVAAATAEAERALAEALKQREKADSLARAEADSLRMLNAVAPQEQTTEDEFFF